LARAYRREARPMQFHFNCRMARDDARRPFLPIETAMQLRSSKG
jgi:hypothetical protein